MSEFDPPSPIPPPPAGFNGRSAGTPPSLQPLRVDAARGVSWWSEGWRLFSASPGVWIGIIVVFIVITVMMSMIPLLGTLATTLLGPVFAGGIMTGCRTQDRGGTLTLAHLFACFSDHLSPLMIVGLLYLVGSCAIMFFVFCAIFLTVGVGSIGAIMSGDAMEAGYTLLETFGTAAVIVVLIALLLAIPLVMAYWFAPALVVFRNAEPWAAMKASFNANLVNMIPMLVYSLVGLGLAIVASIPLLLGWLVVAPMFAASVYASYKDIFGAPD